MGNIGSHVDLTSGRRGHQANAEAERAFPGNWCYGLLSPAISFRTGLSFLGVACDSPRMCSEHFLDPDLATNLKWQTWGRRVADNPYPYEGKQDTHYPSYKATFFC